MNAIEIHNISKCFGEKTVLKDISATLESGKIHGLIGDNGSGKSVLLKCICGLMPVDEGSITMLGTKVLPGRGNMPNIGLIIEHPGFLGELSGYSNLKYLAGIRGKIQHEDILRAIDTVGLTDAKKRRVGKYSLGMRQRLAIAQAIMEDPEILIMDEPFNGLDKTATRLMRTLFLQFREAGKTLIIASHNPADIDMLCDDVFEIENGELSPKA